MVVAFLSVLLVLLFPDLFSVCFVRVGLFMMRCWLWYVEVCCFAGVVLCWLGLGCSGLFCPMLPSLLLPPPRLVPVFVFSCLVMGCHSLC